MAYELDDVDRQVLTLLQEDARYKAVDLAEAIGVSDNTIHNRMERLEEAGVITGYTATVDHDLTGLSFYFHFTCTARISERTDLAKKALGVPNVIDVTELMTGHENLLIEAVGASDEEITEVAEQLDEFAIEINDENLVRAQYTKPLDFMKVTADISEE